MPSDSDANPARVSIAPGFGWDAQQAYLFDIDGTLTRNRDRVHADAFTHAVRRVLGHEISLEGVTVHGSTDTAILHEACLRAGLASESLSATEAAILAAMCDDVDRRRTEMIPVVMPGVEQTLARLHARGAALGLATGNLEAIAWIKMELVGLRHWFTFGGFSDRFPIRPELVGEAARRAELEGARRHRGDAGVKVFTC